MMWARGLSEFGAVVILAYHPMSASVLIYERFASFGLKYSRPIAAIMVLASLIVFIALRLVNAKMSSVEDRTEG
jgi:molybdate/tungstate transport system permease protein